MSRRLFLLAFLLFGCRPKPRGLRVTFLDVGQGDATVIESPSGHVVVVDGGGHPGTDERLGGDPGTRVVVPYLRYRGLSRVDLIVPTHPDDDHVQGLIAVVERLQVQAVLDGGFPSGDGPCQRLRAAIAARKLTVHRALRGQSFSLGEGVQLDVLHPGPTFLKNTHSDTNNNATVLRLTHGSVRVLLMADAESEAEDALLASGEDLTAQVLKVGHHGSRGSTSAALLARVRPQAAVISCGRENHFGHPHAETLARLKDAAATVYRTDQQGALTLESDGTHVTLRSTIEQPPAQSRAGG